MNTQTLYHIKVLGRLWMPTCKAAAEQHIEAGKGPFQREIDPDNELTDLANYLSCNTGDFSSILDFEIEKEIVETAKTKTGYTETHDLAIIRAWESEEVFIRAPAARIIPSTPSCQLFEPCFSISAFPLSTLNVH